MPSPFFCPKVEWITTKPFLGDFMYYIRASDHNTVSDHKFYKE